MAAIGGVGVTLAALELLSRPRALRDDGTLGWATLTARWPARSFSGRCLRWCRPLMAAPGIFWVLAVRAAAGALAAGFLVGFEQGQALGVTLVYGTSVLLAGVRWRPVPGSEGMTHTVFGALTLAFLFWESELVPEACLWFIGGQAALSYLSNGLSKLSSTDWRDGSYVARISRHGFFGSTGLARVLESAPGLGRGLSWGTIGLETLLPLALVGGLPVMAAALGLAALFHLGVALTMGINSFFWAYVSTFPALLFCSQGLHEALVR